MATFTPTLPDESLLDGAAAGEHVTSPHDLDHDPLQHSLAFLDHRSRGHGISTHLAPPGHYLELRDGDEELLIPIRDRIMHIGRSITSDLRFEESQVSRRHAIVVRYGHHVRLLDDRSSNGTFVNGVRIVATDMTEDDVIRLGRLAFRYVRVR
jgi:FHA domain